MIIIDGLKEIEYSGQTCIALGKFDGIHAGHRKLINEITHREDGTKSVVFTFSFDSGIYLDKSERLLSNENRREIFEGLGVDYLVEYELNGTTSKTEPEEFARVILKERLHAREIVCGSDLSFGYMGRGNVALLESMEEELGIKVKVIDKVKYKGDDISSSRIRQALSEGNIVDAEKMLRG